MFLECLFTGLADGIGCIGFPPDKAFVHLDITIFFQVGEVGSKIPVGYAQHLFKVIEIHSLVHQQNAHHPHPDAAVKHFIQIFNGVLHLCIN